MNILEDEGYDAVQLREVASRARTSLATIYKHYAEQRRADPRGTAELDG